MVILVRTLRSVAQNNASIAWYIFNDTPTPDDQTVRGWCQKRLHRSSLRATVQSGLAEGEMPSRYLWPWYDRHFVGIMCGVKGRRFIVIFKWNSIHWFKKMSVWSLTCRKAYLSDHSSKHFWEFYPQDGGENQLALYESKLRHGHSMYTAGTIRNIMKDGRFSGSCDTFCCNLLVAACRLATCMLPVAAFIHRAKWHHSNP